jgi:hypothetical protein
MASLNLKLKFAKGHFGKERKTCFKLFGSYSARYLKKGRRSLFFRTKKFAKTSIAKLRLFETCKLVEAGFEYVTEIEGLKTFRKRK